MAKQRATFQQDFRKFFLRGLGILLPSVLTLAILWWAYGFLQGNIAEPINRAVRSSIIWSAPRLVSEEKLPAWYQVTPEKLAEVRGRHSDEPSDDELRWEARSLAFAKWWRDRWYLQAIGFLIAVALVYLAGVLLGNYLGRGLFERFEALLRRIPVLKQIYPSVKQVVEFAVGSGGPKQFSPAGRVVMVQFPQKGVWITGILMGPAIPAVDRAAGAECVTVFIPSTPTPFTGFTVQVRKDEVIESGITLDEAIRYVVSGGVLIPGQKPGAPGHGKVQLPGASPGGEGDARSVDS